MSFLVKCSDHPLLLFPDFRKVFMGAISVAIAERYFAITFAWWIISQDGENGKWIAMFMATQALPVFLLSPFVGPLIDRYNQKNCMLVGVCMQLVFVSIICGLMYYDKLSFSYLLMLSFCMSCFIPQFEDSVSVSVAKLVDEAHLAGATTIQSSRLEFANIIAAVISTSIIAAAGILYAVYVNVALFALGAVFLYFIKADLSPEVKEGEKKEDNYIAELKSGINYIWNYKELRWYGVIFACETFFIVPIFIMIPMLVKNVLHETVNWVAVFETSLSIGAVAMTLVMSFKQRYRNFYETRGITLGIIGMAMVVVGMGVHPYGMVMMIGIMGATSAALMALSFMMFQYCVPQELKGRFFGIMSTVVAGMYPFSCMFVGFLSDWVTVSTVMLLCGLGLLLLIIPVLVMPRMRKHIGYDDEGQELEVAQ